MSRIEIQIDITGLQRRVHNIAQGLQAPDELMGSLAETLFNIVKDNFAAQGRPSWKPLAASTLKSKKRRGVQSGIGKDSGDMFRSLTPSHSGHTATVSSAIPYAPFFNGGTSRMDAREFMVVPEAGRQSLEDGVMDYIEMLAKR